MTIEITAVELNVLPRFNLKGGKQTGYLINNILTPDEFDGLNKFWEQFHVPGLDWDKTIYFHKGRAHATANQRTFGTHYDRKIFDLPESPEWNYQTPETIYEWSKSKLATSVHPRIIKLFQKVKTLPPFNEFPSDQWIPTRGLINVLVYDQLLAYHTDSSSILYKGSVNDSVQYSITIYLNEVSHGGEFWVDSDPPFVYKPISNSAFIFNGGVALHGVNMNKDYEQRTRKAITFRIAHVDSLYLPGSPDQILYKTHDLQQTIK
jgi:hypothetical protein